MPRHWHQATPPSRSRRGGVQQRRATREVRRQALMAAVVRQLDRITHEDVAHHTGLPAGFLAWAYPTIDDLRNARLPEDSSEPARGTAHSGEQSVRDALAN